MLNLSKKAVHIYICLLAEPKIYNIYCIPPNTSLYMFTIILVNDYIIINNI